MVIEKTKISRMASFALIANENVFFRVESDLLVNKVVKVMKIRWIQSVIFDDLLKLVFGLLKTFNILPF